MTRREKWMNRFFNMKNILKKTLDLKIDEFFLVVRQQSICNTFEWNNANRDDKLKKLSFSMIFKTTFWRSFWMFWFWICKNNFHWHFLFIIRLHVYQRMCMFCAQNKLFLLFIFSNILQFTCSHSKIQRFWNRIVLQISRTIRYDCWN